MRLVDAPLILLVVLHAAQLFAADFPLDGQHVWRLADLETAKKTLTTRDRFIAALSPFDRQSRLKVGREVGEAEFLEFVAAQVLEWTATDAKVLAEVTSTIRDKLAPWRLPLPDAVLLIKTTGHEEGQAAYCRGAAVVLPERIVSGPRERLRKLLTHELFHILSSHNPKLRETMYDIVGFKPVSEVELPEPVRARRITNPDAPGMDFYIEASIDGHKRPLIPVLYSRKEKYDLKQGGEFFSYLEFKLMELDPRNQGLAVRLIDGQPVLHEPERVPDYGAQIGRNTKYIIHAEEVLADNFVLLIDGAKDLPSPRVVEALGDALTR